MPGIFGYLGRNNKEDFPKKIQSLLNHGEDWFDGVFHSHSLGFHGVSDFKINLDSDIHIHENTSIIVYGNVYAYREQKLNGKIAEELLKLYKLEGIEFIKDLDGSFVLSIYDNEKIILANDRLGSKNLFFSLNGEELTYSSEIKGILANDNIKPIMNNVALSEYFTFTYLLDNKTLFNKINLLPPGSYIIYENSKTQFKTYYKLQIKRENIGDHELNEVLKEFAKLLEEAIHKRMKDKNKIGIFLSGGLDSRLLAGFAKRIADKTEKEIISFTFGTKGGRQEKIAKKIARSLGFKNYFYEIPSNSISEYAKELVYKGDGHIRIRDAHFISLLRDVRAHVDVVLVGLFCSELFGEEMLKDLTPIKSKQGLARYLWKWYDYRAVSKHKMNLFSDSVKLTSEPQLKQKFQQSLEELDAISYNDISHLWEISQRDRRYIIAISNYINWYLEARLPFLDNNIVRFALSLPIKLKTNKKLIQIANSVLFPELANIPWEKSGLPPNFPNLLVWAIRIERFIIVKIKELFQRISQNTIIFRNLDYRAYEYILRKDSKAFTIKTLLINLREDIWNKKYIRKIIMEHMNLKKNHEIIICDLLQIELLNKMYFNPT